MRRVCTRDALSIRYAIIFILAGMVVYFIVSTVEKNPTDSFLRGAAKQRREPLTRLTVFDFI